MEESLEDSIETVESDNKTNLDSKQTYSQYSFQTNKELRLQKHNRLAYQNGCDMCEEVSISKSDLVKHKKDNQTDKIPNARTTCLINV